jgi:CRISPR type IV-associated protein Csf3
MSEADRVPIRVTAWLSEPIVYMGDGMHLDGILAAASFRSLPGGMRAEMPSADDAEWPLDMPMPLAKWRVPFDGRCDQRLRDQRGFVWGWCASAVHAEWIAHTRVEVRKRTAVEQMQRYTDAGDVELSSGRFKPADLTLPARVAHRLVWFARGKPEPVREMLGLVTSLGRKRGHGNGVVARWEVETMTEDWSTMRDGHLTRAMPDGYAAGRRRVAGIRPVYWHRSRQMACVLPHERDLVP